MNSVQVNYILDTQDLLEHSEKIMGCKFRL